MNTQDIFTSTPLKGAIVRDWTKETLTVDIVNSLGEKYHFEIKPYDPVPVTVPKGGDTSFGGKCQTDVHLPILAAK